MIINVFLKNSIIVFLKKQNGSKEIKDPQWRQHKTDQEKKNKIVSCLTERTMNIPTSIPLPHLQNLPLPPTTEINCLLSLSYHQAGKERKDVRTQR